MPNNPSKPAPRRFPTGLVLVIVLLLGGIVILPVVLIAGGAAYFFLAKGPEPEQVAQNPMIVHVDDKIARPDRDGEGPTTAPPKDPKDPDPIKPKDPDPIKPKDPDPIKPKDADPIKPKDPDPIKPKDPDPIKPKDPDPIKPKDPDPIKPKDPDPVKPPDAPPVQFKEPVVVELDRAAVGMSLSPDGTMLALRLAALNVNEREIRIVELPSGKEKGRIKTPDQPIDGLVLLSDGKTVIATGRNEAFFAVKDPQYLRHYDFGIGKAAKGFGGFKVTPSPVAFTADGALVAGGENVPKTIRVLDARTGKPSQVIEKAYKNQTTRLVFTADAKYLISAGMDAVTPQMLGRVTIWDLATGKEVRSMPGFEGDPRGLAVSSDGKLIAVAANNKGESGSIRVWEFETGQEVLNIGPKAAERVIFGPDNKTIVTSAYDKVMRVWDLSTKKPLGTFTGHTSGVNGFAFSPDGKTLISIGHDKTIRLWDSVASITPVKDPTVVAKDGDDDPKVAKYAKARVESSQRGPIEFSVDDKKFQAVLDPKAKLMDTDGNMVLPAKLFRVGNVVELKLRKAAKADFIFEARLIEERPSALALSKAKIVGIGPRDAAFELDGKRTEAFWDNNVRIIDKEGKEAAGAPRTVLNLFMIVDVKLRYSDVADRPLVTEVRVVEAGFDPFKKKDKDTNPAVTVRKFENAKVSVIDLKDKTLIRIDDGTLQMQVATDDKSNAFDRDGKQVAIDMLLRNDFRVDGVIEQMNNTFTVREVRPAKASLPDGPAEWTVDKARITMLASTAAAFDVGVGKIITADYDKELKILDIEGRAVESRADRVLTLGMVVAVKFRRGNLVQPLVTEIRVAIVPRPPGKNSFKISGTIQVTEAKTHTLVHLEINGKTIPVVANLNTKTFDKNGKPPPLDAVLQHNARVDLVVRGTYIEEARPAKTP